MLQAYVSSIFRCFIHMFASVSSVCCICLQWVSNVFQAFLQEFQTLFSSVSFVFFCMFQMLHLEVSIIDRMLHIGCAREAAGGADDVWVYVGGVWGLVHSLASPTRYTLICSLCMDASGR